MAVMLLVGSGRIFANWSQNVSSFHNMLKSLVLMGRQHIPSTIENPFLKKKNRDVHVFFSLPGSSCEE